jgi:sugar transferase (PEP-CTERM/EpsH1 system associated)
MTSQAFWPGKAKILHVVDTLGIGGAELSVVKIVERTSEDFRHVVCCIRNAGAAAPALRAHGVSVIELQQPPGSDWRLMLRIARVCRTVRPQIVHTRNWGSMEGIIAARLARVPVIVHAEHGFNADDVGGTNRTRNRVRWALAPFVDRVVAVSDHLRRWLVDTVGLPPTKVTVVRDGVDTRQFQPLSTRDRLRDLHGYSADEFVIGCVARLDPVKNHLVLLEATRLLAARAANTRLMLVGDGPERPVLERRVAELGLAGKVTFLGNRDNIADLLNTFDVFAIASLFEGTSNAIVEAMAAGLPVVATRVGGNPEVVHDGVTGQLVPVGAAAALAAAIEFYRVNDHTRRQHGLAGRRRAEQVYSVEQMVSGYLSVYESGLARHGWVQKDVGTSAPLQNEIEET